MMTEITLEQAKGKQIVDFELSGRELAITFSDGTFTVMRVEYGDDGDFIGQGQFSFYSFVPRKAIRLGIATAAEFAADEAKRKEDQRRCLEMQDRKRLVELIRKYGVPDGIGDALQPRGRSQADE